MGNIQIGEKIGLFAELIWENEPAKMSVLIEKAEETLNWKRSTTYTEIQRLCKRGIFKIDNGVVMSCLSREKYHAGLAQDFVDSKFSGSLADFVAAYVEGRPLSSQDAAAVREIIDKAEGK